MLASRIVSDPGIGLMYAHLSTAPQSLLRETIVYTYKEVPSAGAIVPPLGEVGQVKLRRQVVDLCLRANGRFFLPYQVAYTRAQLERSYPQIREFPAARAEFDPNRVLTSTFVEKIEALLGQ